MEIQIKMSLIKEYVVYHHHEIHVRKRNITFYSLLTDTYLYKMDSWVKQTSRVGPWRSKIADCWWRLSIFFKIRCVPAADVWRRQQPGFWANCLRHCKCCIYWYVSKLMSKPDKLNCWYSLFMSKVILGREPKKILPHVIHHNQSGYVEDRYIGEMVRSIFNIMDFTVQENISELLIFVESFRRSWMGVSCQLLRNFQLWLRFYSLDESVV